ncbi:DUF421 domain-containing protein [Erythrobacter sp. THAF29]|uniref:DUF421 domain-containing protein n=1 Tax=Erythrobacter sp. THAF29 TaxID=2587851 RepID=UPI001268DA3C|nr:YetF domain-containing protein [Erythrobacter sp. THAF29]QFT77324.1 hypothetical protein FIU90_07190 [Erythrobacter sp. THAF29]
MFHSQTEIDLVIRSLLLGTIALIWVTVLIRINGLRSLSKMTNFDFIMTVALGSLLAGAAQADKWAIFLQAIIAMVGLFIAQWLSARLRKASDTWEDIAQNEPLMLMRNGEILHDALKKSRVAESDLIAKLREANVLDFSEVRAVVLETTGDVSVLHGDKLDERLIENVRQNGD